MTHSLSPPRIHVPGCGILVLRGRRWWIRYRVHGKRREESSGSESQRKAEWLLRQRIEGLGKGRRIDPTPEHRTRMGELLDGSRPTTRTTGAGPRGHSASAWRRCERRSAR
jgi:hypothetical protein